MAEDVANLSLKVDTQEVQEASGALGFFKDKAIGGAKAATEFSQSAGSMSDRIKDTVASLERQEASMGKLGNTIGQQGNQYRNLTISQGQYTNAVRMLPAQMSDIATQLQMGTSPFTILVQQGGQIKDSFGGVQNTLRAFAATLSPAIIGATALGVALAGIGYSAYSVSERFDAVNKAIIETGGVGFKSAADLEAAAQRISTATGDSIHSVTDLLVKMQESGKYTTETINQSAEAISKWQDAFGDSDKLQKGLEKMTTDPVKGLQQLNETFHFVTPTVMEHVAALQKAGKDSEAWGVAMDAAMGMVNTRTEQMKGQVGEMEAAWKTLKTVSIEVADGLGKALIGMGDQVVAGFNLLLESVKGILLDIDRLAREAVNGTIDQIRKLPGMSDAFSDAYTQNQELIKKGDQQIIANRKEILRLQQVLNKTAEQQYDDTHKGVTGTGGTTAEEDRQTKKIADQMNKKTKAAKAFQEDAGQKLLDQLNMQTDQLKQQEYIYKNHLTDGKAMTQEQQKYVALLAQINVLEQRQQSGQRLTNEQKQVLAVKEQALAIAKRNADESAQLDILKKQSEQHRQINDAITEMIEKRKIVSDTQGQSTREQERALELAQAESKLRRSGASEGDIKRYTDEVTKGFQQQDAARDDWFNGLSTGWKDAAETAADVNKQMAQFGQSTFTGLTDTLTNFFMTGKDGWKDFANNAIQQIMRILTNSALSDLTKAFSSMGGASGIMGSIGSFFAKGDALYGPGIKALSGGVYDQPTPFTFAGRTAFAKGGVLGEAGPEAVMPLTRGADGKLGVKATGGNGFGSIIVSTDATVTTQGGGDGNQSGAQQLGSMLSKQIADQTQAVLQRAIENGGLIYRFVKGG